MLTSRAWWFLSILVGLLIVGMLIPQPVLALVSLVLLLWLAWEGLLFNFRARWVPRDLVLPRRARDARGPVTSLWAGRLFDVRLALRLRGGSLPHARFEETLPFGLDVASGSPESEGPLSPDAGLTTVYRIRPLHPGRVRFEGVRVQLADLHGLFYHVTFVRSEATFRVLPSLVDAEGKTATSKRHNLLPPPGINRLRRPGTGSELLDLRDYLPGDPPKTIARKVSAPRRPPYHQGVRERGTAPLHPVRRYVQLGAPRPAGQERPGAAGRGRLGGRPGQHVCPRPDRPVPVRREGGRAGQAGADTA